MPQVLSSESWRKSLATQGPTYLAHELHIFYGVTVASFLALALLTMVHDVDSYLQGIDCCKPVLGGTKVRVHFSGISAIAVRPLATLDGSCSRPFTCNVGTAGSGWSAVGLIATPTAFS